jgi:PBP1b-binding outer membrane lipoprotein LpoB
LNKIAALLIIMSLIIAGCQEANTNLPREMEKNTPVESIQALPSIEVSAEVTIAPNSKLSNGMDALIKGDLNKDGIPDVAMIIDDNADASKERDLVIAFGTKKASYEQSIYAKRK